MAPRAGLITSVTLAQSAATEHKIPMPFTSLREVTAADTSPMVEQTAALTQHERKECMHYLHSLHWCPPLLAKTKEGAHPIS